MFCFGFVNSVDWLIDLLDLYDCYVCWCFPLCLIVQCLFVCLFIDLLFCWFGLVLFLVGVAICVVCLFDWLRVWVLVILDVILFVIALVWLCWIW